MLKWFQAVNNWFVKSTQFRRGEKVEKWLDDFFLSRGWTIRSTNYQEHRVLKRGDRLFSKAEKSFYVEYKSGIQTHYTGNIFLETVSVDTSRKPGWVYTCQADYIFYATLLDGCILVFVPTMLREIIEELTQKFPEKSTQKGQNQGYNTRGILVPFEYAKQHLAKKVIAI